MPQRFLFGFFLAELALSMLNACRCAGGGATSDAPLPPLAAPAGLQALTVPGQLAAVVAVPHLATEARPLLIALHGAADFPEWQCNSWKGISHGYGFILCPRGRPNVIAGSERFGFETPGATSVELRAALTALKHEYSRYVAPGPVVLAGFDSGADHALSILRQEPAFFARVALVSGTALDWSSSLSSVYANAGGQRVLFICTSRACDASAERAQAFLRSYAVAVRRVFLGEWGPVFDGRVSAALEAEWPWLVEELPAWQAPH